MQSSTAYFDPYSGQEVDESGNVIQNGLVVEDYFGGNYSIGNGFFYNLIEGGRPLAIGRQGPVRVTDFGSGLYEVLSETLAGQINRQIGPSGLRLVSGTINTLMPDGSLLPLDIAPTNIAKLGRQWGVYINEDGVEVLTQIPGDYRSTADLQSDMGLTWRLATASEAANISLRYAIATGNRDVLKDKATELNMFNENGQPDISGLVRFIMEQLPLSQLRAFTSFLTQQGA